MHKRCTALHPDRRSKMKQEKGTVSHTAPNNTVRQCRSGISAENKGL